MTPNAIRVRNEESISLNTIPVLTDADFMAGIQEHRICAYFGVGNVPDTVMLYGVCADDRNGFLYISSCKVNSDRFPSLVTQFPQVHLFEREIWEQTGLVFDGHPWLKPVRFPQKSALSN
ncbi:MAG: NADH-quinone oxidoreductase subunit C, partial [Pseudomonadota bacterium]